MSEHRRKPPQPQGGGRAAARRGQSASSGRRAAPRGATGSLSETYGPGGEENQYEGRAATRRASQRSADSGIGGSRRRAAEPAGRGPGRGRGRADPPGKQRFIDYPRAGKYGVMRWVPSWRQATGLLIGFFGSLVAAAGIGYAVVAVPDPAQAATAQNNVYYWSDGSQMVATGGEVNRQIIAYEKIPKAMRYAVMSAENKTFETDSGVDPMGIARAVVNMAKGGQTQGGSTITQQYVKNAMLDDQSQTLSRKVKELFISVKVGTSVEKEEIMSGYLNTAYYGRGAYGIQAAARTYFGKDAEKLNPSQCAFLAAVLKGATYYDPAGAPSIDPEASPENNRKRATYRWRWILNEMVKDKHLPAAERNKYNDFPKIQSPRSNAQLGGQIGYLVDTAKGYILNNTDITQKQLEQGGYEIHTTFDKKKVKELEKAVVKVRKENIKPGQRPDTDTHVQFGGASVNPKSGAIEAIYGGEDATKHFTNNADVTGAQVGSTFKTYVLAAAMTWGKRDPDLADGDQAQDERTIVSPKSLYSGKNNLKIKDYDGQVWTNEKGEEWLQANDDDASYGRAPKYQIDLREAMRVSANSAFVQLGMDVGLDRVKEAAVAAGLKENSLTGTSFPSFSIGISDPSAIRMAGSYATFAASGKQNDPFSVKTVEHEGLTMFDHDDIAEPKRAFTAKVADNVTDVLKTVVDEGTGTSARLTGREVAGKTGTTDGNKSAWFVGYTPQLSTAISMYRMDDDESNKNRKFLEMYGTGGQETIHGASFPAEIWHDYMEDALQGQPAVDFPEPQPIGVIVNDDPDPTPTPTPTESEEEPPEPSPTPSESDPEPSPTPSDVCDNPFDPSCEDPGDTDAGGTDVGGADGGVTPTPTESEDDSRGNQNGGGLFGGPNG
ncbi:MULTISPECIES: transglycosylase domain-containing protein [Streptomyces]|uniref:transglycosylase domain-containing protein n=1 Tax=Streptomyces TaxID=1883 RepID=UPI000AA5B1DA|nr:MULTISPECIES: transglycosylase domain-containing protein [Streptomyces]MDW8474223.1 transglycosylase domain-containing protein [Streptomyces scabiei]MDX2532857.1 transglycosylase domain-containing protein [Streptomyces scabiei]MDX2568753.1 transglycosylase domain-containing protein [Streptomyces scabiei]MDX2574974.1 transglycosylase domain-containing protein [Streptomyces scabiei]MDX2627755.1 transglycosylase domain-containing protein [Streptomyces scabiei]